MKIFSPASVGLFSFKKIKFVIKVCYKKHPNSHLNGLADTFKTPTHQTLQRCKSKNLKIGTPAT